MAPLIEYFEQAAIDSNLVEMQRQQSKSFIKLDYQKVLPENYKDLQDYIVKVREICEKGLILEVDEATQKCDDFQKVYKKIDYLR